MRPILICLLAFQGVVSWQDAGQYAGQVRTVEGTVYATLNTGTMCHINFSPDWQTGFKALLFAKDFDKFPPHPEEYYRGRTLQISGTIRDYKGRPAIILTQRGQIRELGSEKAAASVPDAFPSVPSAAPSPAPSIPASVPGSAPWQPSAEYPGGNWKVEGTIVATKNDGVVCYLSFTGDWRRDFNVVIFAGDFAKFPPRPEVFYRGRKVGVTGPVGIYRGKPEVIVTDPGQIRMPDAAIAALPPPASLSVAPDGSLASAPAAKPGPVYLAVGKDHHIMEVLDEGAIVRLDDGSRWRIFPLDRKDTAKWRSTAVVVVQSMSRPMGEHGYILLCKDNWVQAFASFLGPK